MERVGALSPFDSGVIGPARHPALFHAHARGSGGAIVVPGNHVVSQARRPPPGRRRAEGVADE